MFKLLRFYSIASFILIFISAALLTLFYREVTVQWVTRLTEEHNIVLAQTTLNAIRPALVKHLKADAATDPQSFPPELAETLRNAVRNTSIIRLKIYNRKGVVVFSTIASQIGTNKSDNAGFLAAINGSAISSLVYRDTFNAFEKTTERDNLLRSYIPVSISPGEPVQGVFEIYTDVNWMAEENERILFIILLGAELILGILFAALILVVRRANQHLESQQQRIRERMASLEVLSNRLLNSDEQDKQKIAFGLHEGLAQTLSAIKANVENSRLLLGAENENAKALESIVPIIQGAIQDVRNIATGLRPPSLDDLGLIPTIHWFCSEFERSHPGVQIRTEIQCTEDQIPVTLKIVIYRIIESAFSDIAHQAHAGWIQLDLKHEDDGITLQISGTGESSAAQQGQRPHLQLRFAEVRERTMLSSGIFSATQDLIGKITLTSSWPGQDEGKA